jgi:hypothetical protein
MQVQPVINKKPFYIETSKNVIKAFSSSQTPPPNKLECLYMSGLFQQISIFASKARAYLSGEPFMYSPRSGFWPNLKMFDLAWMAWGE